MTRYHSMNKVVKEYLEYSTGASRAKIRKGQNFGAGAPCDPHFAK